jgi:hypothetical protein
MKTTALLAATSLTILAYSAIHGPHLGLDILGWTTAALVLATAHTHEKKEAQK